jgi:hypothetical protein
MQWCWIRKSQQAPLKTFTKAGISYLISDPLIKDQIRPTTSGLTELTWKLSKSIHTNITLGYGLLLSSY